MTLNIIIPLMEKRTKLLKRKEALEEQHNKEICEIQNEINEVVKALNCIEKYITPLLCSHCKGTGVERYCDAAGDMDERECNFCNGTGINYKSKKT